MAKFEVAIPDRIDSDIDRLVDQGDFLNREKAVEDLLSLGISSYGAVDDTDDQLDDDLFTQAVDDQHDPASQRDEPL
ncbi:hypothetical protein SAMN05421858_2912 [Haladaptatus litoreus]|uniref:CopG family transcriptional regulator n=1 Tax=Haladaptatus litoreus TaxID=553468 RepID=A0A1N7C268_9EURY|nr:CopG family transcriptional regulator [Haladaptatus litoreus]SIR57667.1 hypothetical protein SAMN05421858_2912 [Haladaptatus litoreus]